MNPERWEQMSRIFKSAVERPRDERAAFVREACSGDDSLQLEIQALLSSFDQAADESFINSPAFELAAPSFIKEDALSQGQLIAHYEVIKKLGAGGMGEVYLAHDTKLERKVALKILPTAVARDRARMLRFIQEAKTASSLNHPNILVIHEIGEADTLRFIATEFVEGTTLRERIASGPLEFSESLDIAIQTASALSAAHAAGIVHRDIKPENIMVRKDGYVKVLDFGIAKLMEKPTQTLSDTEAPTLALLKTEPGAIIGTVNYMSPEQARGLEVDVRTDIWSLGVVIYETVTGGLPFSGETKTDVLSLILQRDPPPLRQGVRDAPDELQYILDKALTKEKALRYQTAKELQVDLQRLKKRLEFETERERSAAPDAPDGKATPSLSADREAPASTVATTESKRASSSRTRALILLTASLLVATAAGLLVWKAFRPETRTTSAPAVVLPERRLGYWIEVQKYRNGKPYQDPFRLGSEINFEKDYRIRLHVSSADAGYLYVLNESPEANSEAPFNILFPSQTSNDGSAHLSAGQEAQIPAQSWFSFDQEAGVEKLWLVWSATGIAELEEARRFANEKDKGEIKDAELNRKIKELLSRHSGSQITAEKSKEMTNVSARDEILVHAVNLEHH